MIVLRVNLGPPERPTTGLYCRCCLAADMSCKDQLLIVEEWLTLTILCTSWGTSFSTGPAEQGRHANHDSAEEEHGHDNESKDPLEGNNLFLELVYPETCREVAHGEAKRVVLEDGQVEATKHEERPHSNVGKDTSSQVPVGTDHNSAIPEDGNKDPGQRSRDNRHMHKARLGRVPEVEHDKVEEVDNKQQLGQPEVTANPQHNPAKLNQVEEDEVAANTSCSSNEIRIGREQMSYIANLEDPEDDPIDIDEDLVDSERSWVSSTLAPDGAILESAFFRAMMDIVALSYDHEQPGQDRENLVRENAVAGVGVPAGKRVEIIEVRHCAYSQRMKERGSKQGREPLTVETAS